MTFPARNIDALFADLTWEQLRPIAERHGVYIAGRRREPLLERIQARLSDPAHLVATVGVLGPGARMLLGMLVLRGGAASVAELDTLRQQLSRARPDLAAELAAVRASADATVLAGLGLCVRRSEPGRRGSYVLVVPAEVLGGLPPLVAATISVGAGEPAWTWTRVYAQVSQIVAVFEGAGVRSKQSGNGPPESPMFGAAELAVLSRKAELDPAILQFWLPLLARLGVLALSDGRWMTRSDRWSDLRPPGAITARSTEAWLAVTAAQGDPVADRVWRSVRELGPGTWSIPALRATFAALEAAPPDPDGGGSQYAAVDDALTGLERLGLIEVESSGFRLASPFPVAVPLPPPAVEIRDMSVLVSHAGSLTEPVLSLLESLGPARQSGSRLCWTVTQNGLMGLLAEGWDAGDLLAVLGAYVSAPASFAAQVSTWSEGAAALELHYPLPILVARDAETMRQMVATADLSAASHRLGERSLLLDPADADAVVERLQKHGFWPRHQRD